MALDVIMQRGGQRRLPPLVLLPVEILYEIATYLVLPAHLNNLSRTCRRMRAVILPKLYQHLTLNIPLDWSSLTILENLLDPEAEGLQYVRGLAVMTLPERVEVGRDDKTEIHRDRSHRRGYSDGDSNTVRKKLFRVEVLNTFIRLILRAIPENKLEYFHWYQNGQLEWTTLDLLSNRHGTGLADLQFQSALKSSLPTSNLSKLITLKNSDIEPGDMGTLIPELIVANHGKLRHLRVGFEKFISRNMEFFTGRHERAMLQAQEHFYNEVIRSFQELGLQSENGEMQEAGLCLESLHLACFGFTEKSIAMFDFKNLTSLRLESSLNQSGFRLLMDEYEDKDCSSRLPALKSFHLRSGHSHSVFHADLKAFLLSFSGLVNLSLLLEGPDPVPSLVPFLQNHGPTLESLVWDQRYGPRCSTFSPTELWHPTYPGLCTREIAMLCPNLRELGLIMEIATNRHYSDLALLTQLRHLETLNLRNLPKQIMSRITPTIARQEHEALATDIAMNFLEACPADCSPKLKIITTGTVTYMDYRVAVTNEKNPSTKLYLSPRFFHVAWPINVKTLRVPILTLVAQGTATEAQEYSSNLRIFEDYWMR